MFSHLKVIFHYPLEIIYKYYQFLFVGKVGLVEYPLADSIFGSDTSDKAVFSSFHSRKNVLFTMASSGSAYSKTNQSSVTVQSCCVHGALPGWILS